MFKKLKKLFNAKKEQHKHNYNLTFDNVAIPEIHTHKSDKNQEETPFQHPIQYDNVAIPKFHIRAKKNKKKSDYKKKEQARKKFSFFFVMKNISSLIYI